MYRLPNTIKMSRITILLFFYCSSLYSQYDASKLVADDVPNIVQHIAKAKAVLNRIDFKEEMTIPTARIELLYLENLKDTSHLSNRIQSAESLESLLEFYPDSDFVGDAFVYKLNGYHNYELDQWRPYKSMVHSFESGADTFSIEKRRIAIEKSEEYYRVLIMDKVILSESKPLHKPLLKSKAYTEAILNPKPIRVDSSIVESKRRKREKLKEISIDQHLVKKATDYYNNAIARDSFILAERLKDIPLKRLIDEDPNFVSLLNEAYVFAKKYATTSDRFNYIIKPLLSKKEYYELFLLLDVPQMNNTACDFDDKMARAAYIQELILRSFEADKANKFFRMYNGVLSGYYYWNSSDYFTHLDSFLLLKVNLLLHFNYFPRSFWMLTNQ